MAREFLTREDASHAVTLTVKTWRVDADAKLPIHDSEDSASDPAFDTME